jgi:hypothetical protein
MYSYKHPAHQAANKNASVPFQHNGQLSLTFRQAYERNKKLVDKNKRSTRQFRFVPIDHNSASYAPILRNQIPSRAPHPPVPQQPDNRRSTRITTTDDSGRLNSLELKHCYQVLQKLITSDQDCVFAQPVNPTLHGCADYFNIIKNPMDLGTVRSELISGKISGQDEFTRLVSLVFDNATAFNPITHPVHQLAVRLKAHFERLMLEPYNPNPRPAVSHAVSPTPPPPVQNRTAKKRDTISHAAAPPPAAVKRQLKHDSEGEDDDDFSSKQVIPAAQNTKRPDPASTAAIPSAMPGMQGMPWMQAMPGMQGMMPGMQGMQGMPGMMPGMPGMPGMPQGMMPGMQGMPQGNDMFASMWMFAMLNGQNPLMGQMGAPMGAAVGAEPAAAPKSKKPKKQRTNADHDGVLSPGPVIAASSMAPVFDQCLVQGGNQNQMAKPSPSLFSMPDPNADQKMSDPRISEDQIDHLQDLASSLPDSAIDGLLDLLRTWIPNLDPDDVDVSSLTVTQYETAKTYALQMMGNDNTDINGAFTSAQGQGLGFTSPQGGYDIQPPSDQEF